MNNLVTDVFVGCNLKFLPRLTLEAQSHGKITDIQVFDRILTVNEMMNMTTCGGDKLTGNLVNSNLDPSTVYGKADDATKQINIHSEEICPTRNFSAVLYEHYDLQTLHAIDFCQKIKRSLVSVLSDKDKDNVNFYFEYIKHWTGWLNTPLHKIANGSWVDMDSGKPTILSWAQGQPIQNEAFKYARIEIGEDMILGSQPKDYKGPALCVSEDSKDYRLYVQILGLCDQSAFDTEYVFTGYFSYPDNTYSECATYGINTICLEYIGKLNSDIRYIGDGVWQFRSKMYSWMKQATKIAGSPQSMALGTHDVSFDQDACTKGKDNKVVKITITLCSTLEFTCADGNCVSMDHRCDRIVDCPDSSDERDCWITQLDRTTYVKEYPPITVDGNRTLLKMPINVSLDILKILEINEVEGIFHVSFRLHVTWFDFRLIYANLKNDEDLNTLTEQEKADIWTPNVVFSNTKNQAKVIKDTDAVAKISRKGEYKISSKNEAIRVFYFRGVDNPIRVSRIYDIRFICSYDMAWYPFDLQRCELLFKPFGNSGKYVYFVVNNIKYFDKMDLSKYYIKQWKLLPKETDTGTGVEGKYWDSRKTYS